MIIKKFSLFESSEIAQAVNDEFWQQSQFNAIKDKIEAETKVIETR